MARVQISTLGWGVLLDGAGNGRANYTVALTQLDGTTPVGVYTTAGGSTPAALITDIYGRLPGFVDEGTYLLTVDGDVDQVEAVQAEASLAARTGGIPADGSVTNAKIGDGAVNARTVSATLKPSGSAATTDEAMRALGTTAGTAAAGNDSRFAAAAQGLAPTVVKTANYTAAAADFVPVDASGGSVTVTLPTAPADKTRVGVKLIAVSGTNTASIARGGTDVFNKTAGSTSLTLSELNQSVMLQYQASGGIWYVQSTDMPLGAAWVDLASAATLTIPPGATHVNVTGTTNITGIAASYDGREVMLRFNGVLTFGTLTAASGATLTLVYNQTSDVWVQKSAAGMS